MKVTHLQSSTQIIHLDGISILTDPWLTDGEYYGSWYHYPPFEKARLESLEYDYIYVSHIHPDHLSEDTFRKLPKKKPVLIHNYASKFLKKKIELLGYEVIECNHGKPYEFNNDASITIYAADNCNPELCGRFLGCGIVEKKFGSTQIDTLAVFKCLDKTLINTNDCPFSLAKATIKGNELHNLDVDLLLVGYAGAGPYPQCFSFDNIEEKKVAAKAKEKQFLDQATSYISLIRPQKFAPFAGTYILGSRLASLTEFRGVPSLSFALSYLNKNLKGVSAGLLLEQLDTYDLTANQLTKFEQNFSISYPDYLKRISKYKLSYDDDDWDDSEISAIIEKAFLRFRAKSEEIGFHSNSEIIVQSEKIAYIFNTQNKPVEIPLNDEIKEPFVKIMLDHNLLNRLLRGPRFAHWNNAEIGSHLKYIRKPNIFERGLFHCMCFFHQ